MFKGLFKLIKHFWLSLVNLKEKIFHRITHFEIEIIKNTHLFDSLNQEEFSNLINNIYLIHYNANDLIFEEGSIGEACYIVLEGSVCVFSYTINKEKIALARLDKGNYFGEQALIGEANKSRNASIEAITPTILIKIDKHFVNIMLKKDYPLKEKLSEIGNLQLIKKIIKVVDAYEQLERYVKQQTEYISSYSKDEIIFNVNDKADYAYIILEGSVNVAFQKNDGGIQNIILSKGNILGELAVIRDLARAGTASAREYTRLVQIDKANFKKFYEENPKLRTLLKTLNKIYALPNRGIATQILGKVDNAHTVTTTYELEDGRFVIAVNAESDFFMMEEANHKGQIYSYKKERGPQIEITIDKDRIIGVKCFKIWADLANVCAFILDKKIITKDMLDDFTQNGIFKPIECEQSEIICSCLSISKNKISTLIEQGHNSLQKISNQSGACSVCGFCRNKILDMLGQNLWLSAMMTKSIQHNNDVISYYIDPLLGVFNSFTPGEHLVIQLKMMDHWIERPYIVSDLGDKGRHRITIKKEEGTFTTWLFNNKIDKTLIYVSQPQGNFKLISDSNNPIVCFAQGIGVTPFLTFAKSLLSNQPKRNMYLFYFEKNQNDFIFLDEFEVIKNKLPTFKLNLWDTSISSLPSEKEIAKLLQDYEGADIYICGQEGFELPLLASLKNLNFRQDKIHIEKFTYTNSP